jgi:hypothetical protein
MAVWDDCGFLMQCDAIWQGGLITARTTHSVRRASNAKKGEPLDSREAAKAPSFFLIAKQVLNFDIKNDIEPDGLILFFISAPMREII